jgi:uncharacterized OB-fold protein
VKIDTTNNAPIPASEPALTVLDEDGETTLAPCNDCGLLIPDGDMLCAKCFKEELDGEEWDNLHPEERCPPRE